MPPPGSDPMSLAMDDHTSGGGEDAASGSASAPMDVAIAAMDDLAAEAIADEAPDMPEPGVEADPGMVDEQPQDDPSDIA